MSAIDRMLTRIHFARPLMAAGFLALCLAIATVAAADTTVQAGVTIWDEPRPLPEVLFVDGDEQVVALADFGGKVVLLNLWATWCTPCREEMPTLDRLQAQLGGEDFEVVALSIDQAGMTVVEAFYTEIGIAHLRRYLDSTADAADTLNAFGLPTTLIVDREGRELGRKVGPAEWDSPEIVELLQGVIDAGASP